MKSNSGSESVCCSSPKGCKLIFSHFLSFSNFYSYLCTLSVMFSSSKISSLTSFWLDSCYFLILLFSVSLLVFSSLICSKIFFSKYSRFFSLFELFLITCINFDFIRNSFCNSMSISSRILLRRSKALSLKLAAVLGYSEHKSRNLLFFKHIILVGSNSCPGSQ